MKEGRSGGVNKYTYRYHDEAHFELWCHNKECDLYNQRRKRLGLLDPDTGWGEPNDPDCMACGEELYSWEDEDGK